MARGRPGKLTPEVQEKILEAIRDGNYYEAACAYAGITYRTFRYWMERGEEEADELQKPAWITSTEASELISVSSSKIRYHARRERFLAKKQGRIWLVDRKSLLSWADQQEHEVQGSEHLHFFHAVQKAEAEAEVQIVSQWKKQIPNNWRAARDFLARRHSRRWGPKEQHHIDADVRTKAEVIISIPDNEREDSTPTGTSKSFLGDAG